MAAPGGRQCHTPTAPEVGTSRSAVLSGLRSFHKATADVMASIQLPRSGEYAAVMRAVAEHLAARLGPTANALGKALRLLARTPGPEGWRIMEAWTHLAGQGAQVQVQDLRSDRGTAERLMHVDLAICLWDAWRRLIEAELSLAPLRSRR